MDLEKATPVICRYCLKPMQEAEIVRGDGKVIARRYICGCQGTVFHATIHSGDKTKEDK
jgi:hypothetical protein